MEKIMSKTNDTSRLDHTKLENRVLADSELDAVSGGVIKTMGNVKWDAIELRRGTSGNSSFGTER
jgi:hypothetical protein